MKIRIKNKKKLSLLLAILTRRMRDREDIE